MGDMILCDKVFQYTMSTSSPDKSQSLVDEILMEGIYGT